MKFDWCIGNILQNIKFLSVVYFYVDWILFKISNLYLNWLICLVFMCECLLFAVRVCINDKYIWLPLEFL